MALQQRDQTSRAAIANAVANEVTPILGSGGLDHPLDDTADARLQQVLEASQVLGAVPETGLGEIDWLAAGRLIEVVAQTNAGLAMRLVHDVVLPPALLALMIPTTRERFEHLLSGGRRFAGAFSDSQAGSNLLETRVTAERDGSLWSFDGTKEWVTGAHRSDTLLLTARVDDDQIPLPFLVERETSPYRTSVAEMTGLQLNPLARVELDGVHAPADACVDDGPNAFQLVLDLILRSRCLIAAATVGVAQRALDLAVQYAVDRHQFGKRISTYQLVQDLLAEMATQVTLGRLAYERAMILLAEGGEPKMEASVAKRFCSEAALQVTTASAQVHGARGLTAGSEIDRLVRDARMLAVAEGTTQIHTLIIARCLTEGPRLDV